MRVTVRLYASLREGHKAEQELETPARFYHSLCYRDPRRSRYGSHPLLHKRPPCIA